MRPQKLIRIGIQTALFSVLLSSIIYFAYYYTSYNFIVYLQYIFIFLIGTISFIILLRIINHIAKHKRSRKPLIATSILIIISGIIALVYFRRLTNLLDTMRINFVNQGNYALTDIKITGCQKKYINSIAPKGNESVWIKISRDCAISLSYNENGRHKTAIVSAYVTTSMGQKLTFKIGGNK
jgi:hypothetical protein